MFRYHTIETIWRYIRKGCLLRSIVILFKVIRSKLSGQHRLVFALTKDDLANVNLSTKNDAFEVIRVVSWDMISNYTKRVFKENHRYIWWDTEAMLRQGGYLWLGYFEGHLATIAWTRKGNQLKVYFFPLCPGWVVISHCVTLPSFRGCGLYPATIAHIVQHLMAEGIKQFYIDCSDWNLTSKKGIRRVGFRLIGQGRCKTRGGLIWYPKVT